MERQAYLQKWVKMVSGKLHVYLGYHRGGVCEIDTVYAPLNHILICNDRALSVHFAFILRARQVFKVYVGEECRKFAGSKS